MGENLPALSSPFPTDFAPITKEAHWTGSGYAYRFRFPNNFGASVIPDRSSWELAVLELTNSGAWELCYSTVVTDDVLPGLSEQDVADKLAVIARLDSNGRLPLLKGRSQAEGGSPDHLEARGRLRSGAGRWSWTSRSAPSDRGVPRH